MLRKMSDNVPVAIESADDLEAVFLYLHEDIYGYIYARVRERATAEDITQQVFVKAWEKRGQFRPKKGSLKNWIYAIALNAVRDHLRAHKNKPVAELPDDLSTDQQLEQEYKTHDQHQLVLQEMQHLSHKEQDLLTLRFVQGYSIEEIGACMRMKYSATKVALHRATKKLRQRCNRFAP